MIRCCREAKSYLKKAEVMNSDELQNFIDRFNVEIENYSENGLSSYLLGCVELCLKLSGSVDYTKGQMVTEWLKGHALFLSGHYSLAQKCYFQAMELQDGLGENFTVFDKEREYSRNEFFSEMNRLVDSGTSPDSVNSSIIEDNQFFSAYNQSIKALIQVKEGAELNIKDIIEMEEKLSSKKYFYHHIDALMNISEIYHELGEHQRSFDLLTDAIGEERELDILDCRLQDLFKKLSLVSA